MKKLALGLILATSATAVWAQATIPVGGATNVVAGSSAVGAGGAVGAAAVIPTSTLLIGAGVAVAGAVAAGGKTESTTTHTAH